MRRALIAASAVGVVLSVGLGGYRVATLERGELDRASAWVLLEPTSPEGGGPPEPHMELLRVDLGAGEEVFFELCTRDELRPDPWSGALELAVWHPESREVAVRTPVDDDLLGRARRSPAGSCVLFAHAAALAEGGLFAVEAVWTERELPEAVARVPVRLRVLADRPLTPADRWIVVLLMAAASLFVVGAAWPRRDARDLAPPSPEPCEGPEAEPEARRSLAGERGPGRVVARLFAAVTGFAAFGLLLGLVPIGGATAGLARGLLLAGVQVGLALALSGGLSRSAAPGLLAAVGLARPSRAAWALGLAPLVGVLLWLAGRALLAVIPSTGEAPIETLVAWPSGELAVSLAGVLVPIAEEVFFRGFVFGTVARRFGAAAAFVVTVVLFTAAHLPQVWGAWGGLAAIALTGTGLTALRAWTGSTLAPALAHVTHNGAISVLAALL